MSVTAWVILGGVLAVLVLVGLAVWLFVDVHRINRHPEDDFPVSRHRKGEWDE